MSGTVFYIVLFLSAGGAAWLASRAERWRDARWVGVLAIIVFADVFAAATGHGWHRPDMHDDGRGSRR